MSAQADRTAPRPLPIYMDERTGGSGCHMRSGYSPSATDLHYELLCLWAAQERAARAGGDGRGAMLAGVDVEGIAALLQVWINSCRDQPLHACVAVAPSACLHGAGAWRVSRGGLGGRRLPVPSSKGRHAGQHAGTMHVPLVTDGMLLLRHMFRAVRPRHTAPTRWMRR
eukprot:100385-Chlamydomonas_euryale.AAC.25